MTGWVQPFTHAPSPSLVHGRGEKVVHAIAWEIWMNRFTSANFME